MGDPDAPSSYAPKKSMDHVETAVGDPIVKVYINQVHHAIAQGLSVSTSKASSMPLRQLGILHDYSDPLTRFAMSDYARDGRKGMSQVQNSEKMMLKVPAGVSSSAVRMNGQIVFVNEMLRCSDGSLFFPERFQYAATVGGRYFVRVSISEFELDSNVLDARRTVPTPELSRTS